jgi:hypothetical protein
MNDFVSKERQNMKLFSWRNAICVTVLAFGLATVAPWASATPITPGTSGPPDLLFPIGSIVGDTGVVAFSNGLVSGSTREVVIREGSGFLDFVYAIHNNGPDNIVRSTTANYGTFLTDVGFDLTSLVNLLGDVSTVAPLTVDRNASGSTVGFNFGLLGFPPGTDTFNLVIETNAQFFTGGTLSFIDGGTATVAGFAPTNTPEPASLALMGTGIVFCARLLRRKKKTAEAAITA